jgi:hypothetical protein
MISLDKLNPEVQRALALAVPAAVLLFAASMVGPKLQEINRVQRQAQACEQAAALRRQQNLMELAAEGRQRLAASPQTREEPLAFLRELNRLVALSGVRLISYKPPAALGTASLRAPGGEVTQEAGSAAPSEAKNSLVKPIQCEVTVSGSFADQVSLFQKLARSERLFTVNHLQVRVETYPYLSATFQIVRYVTPVNVAINGAQGDSFVRTASAAGARSWQ